MAKWIFILCLFLPGLAFGIDQIGPVDPTDIDNIEEHDTDEIDMFGESTWAPVSGDMDAPMVSITTTDDQSIDADTLSVAWVAVDNVGIVECRWYIGGPPNDTAGSVDSTSPATTSGYASGKNSVYVGCRDAAGHWGFDVITVTYTADMVYAEIEVTWETYDDQDNIQGFKVYSADSQFGFEQMPDRVIATVADPTATSVTIEDVPCAKFIGVVAYDEANESGVSAETPQIVCD